MTDLNEANRINAEIELSVYGPLGGEQATAASSWEIAKLLADAFERIERLESQTASRAALAEPEPEGPTLRQLMMLADDMEMASVSEAAEYARAVLARWGNQSMQPISVSERLPGAEDCDAEGKCWWWYPPVPEQTYGYWAHEDDAVPERAVDEQPSHWLPAHALSQPS